MTTNPTSDTFDELTAAVGRFLDEVAEKARREKPAVHAVIDTALQSGECYALLTIKLLPGGIRVLATVNRISDDAALVTLDEVDAVAMGPDA